MILGYTGWGANSDVFGRKSFKTRFFIVLSSGIDTDSPWSIRLLYLPEQLQLTLLKSISLPTSLPTLTKVFETFLLAVNRLDVKGMCDCFTNTFVFESDWCCCSGPWTRRNCIISFYALNDIRLFSLELIKVLQSYTYLPPWLSPLAVITTVPIFTFLFPYRTIQCFPLWVTGVEYLHQSNRHWQFYHHLVKLNKGLIWTIGNNLISTNKTGFQFGSNMLKHWYQLLHPFDSFPIP